MVPRWINKIERKTTIHLFIFKSSLHYSKIKSQIMANFHKFINIRHNILYINKQNELVIDIYSL